MGAARARPDLRLVLGYEEALGFAVGDEVRDKDGIGAALVMADLVARLRAEGRTLDDRLDELAVRHGLHLSGSRSFRFHGLDGDARRSAAMAALRADPPAELDGRPVRRVVDHRADRPPAPVADVRRAGARRRGLDGRAPEWHRAQAEGLRRGRGAGGSRASSMPPGPGPRRRWRASTRPLAEALGFPDAAPALG